MLDAAAAMEWVPAGAIELRTDEYRLIRYPDVVLDPTFRAAQVTWSRTRRPLAEVIDEIASADGVSTVAVRDLGETPLLGLGPVEAPA